MKNILYIFAIIFVSSAFAQQEMQFASSFQNPYLYNPAAGGLSNVTQIDLTTRLQWMGINGPVSVNLSGHSVVGAKNSGVLSELEGGNKFLQPRPKYSVGALKHIVGGKIISDQIGVFSRMGVYGSYAIHLPVTNDFNIGVGLGLGWGNYRINPNRVTLYDEIDDTYAMALGKSSQQSIFDATAGIVFYGKGLFFGFSTTNMFKNKAKFSSVDTKSFYARHYNITLSYGIKMGSSVLEPAIIGKFAAHAPVNFDFGARFLYKNAIWLGVYGRTSNNVVFQFGTTLVQNIYVSYAYELSVGKIRNAAGGTHEIQLGIYIGKHKQKAAKDDSKGKVEVKDSNDKPAE
ncbi:MAG: PorP/SprF family type IX secretion system membrane protein [Crocinitomicaceae bacterium]|nr:PorP/SprF family type IX secretion system membrane protein [Crocinitomicaceae bacterium]